MSELSQDQVNGIVRTERRQWEAKIAARRAELEVERGKAVALQQEHDDLAAKLAEFATKSAADLAALQAESDARCEALLKETESMQEKFAGFQVRAESDRITEEIRSAAQAAGAYNPDQFVDLLRSKARQLPNGEVVLRDVMPAGLQSAAEAVDYMRAEPSYANLFKDGI